MCGCYADRDTKQIITLTVYSQGIVKKTCHERIKFRSESIKKVTRVSDTPEKRRPERQKKRNENHQ